MLISSLEEFSINIVAPPVLPCPSLSLISTVFERLYFHSFIKERSDISYFPGCKLILLSSLDVPPSTVAALVPPCPAIVIMIPEIQRNNVLERWNVLSMRVFCLLGKHSPIILIVKQYSNLPTSVMATHGHCQVGIGNSSQ